MSSGEVQSSTTEIPSFAPELLHLAGIAQGAREALKDAQDRFGLAEANLAAAFKTSIESPEGSNGEVLQWMGTLPIETDYAIKIGAHALARQAQ